MLAKCAGAWAATALPLVVVSPVLGLLLGMEPEALGVTTLTLLIGSPALTLIGAIGAALMTALGRGGLLVAVLVLPFTIPVLIFGVSATYAVIGPMPLGAAAADPGGAQPGQRRGGAGGRCRGAQDRDGMRAYCAAWQRSRRSGWPLPSSSSRVSPSKSTSTTGMSLSPLRPAR